MLLLAAIVRTQESQESPTQEAVLQPIQLIGHMGLAVIAIVFVLLTFWQR